MVRWDADADRLLLIAIVSGIPVHLSPEALERAAQAFPPDPETGERPTPKAITERLYRMKTMIKKYGTAEPRRVKKQPEQIAAGSSDKPAEAPKPRTPVASTNQASKPKAAKRKRSKSKAAGEELSDDEDYAPANRCSREAKALMKENPDFNRYGKGADKSRKRARKNVRYNEDQVVKGEPQSEEEETFVDAREESVVPTQPNLHRPVPIDTSAANACNYSVVPATMGYEAPHQPANSYTGVAVGNNFEIPLATPVMSYPSWDQMSPHAFGTASVTPSYYPTPSSSFSSSDYGNSSFDTHPHSRHDSFTGSRNFGGYNSFSFACTPQSTASTSMEVAQHNLDGPSSPVTPVGGMTNASPLTPPSTFPTKNSRSQLGGLKRTMSSYSSPTGDGSTSIPPAHTFFTTQSSTVQVPASAPYIGSNLELEEGPPIMQRSATDSGLLMPFSSQTDLSSYGEINSTGLGIEVPETLDESDFIASDAF